jgi:hypothetical protein
MSELRLAGNYVDYTWPLGGDGGAEFAFARMRRPRTILASALLASAMLATAVGALSVAGAAPAAAQEPEAEQCLNPQVCPIPYMRLSKQETEPFLFYDDVVDANHPWAYDYGAAIRRFPDVRSCLIEKERNKPQPDLRQIDWVAIDNIREIEVCVFRIASSIDDVESVKLWLQYHEFAKISARPMYHNSYVPKSENDPLFALEYHLSIDRFRKIVQRTWLTGIIGLELGRNYSIHAYFSQSGKVAGVISTYTSKLSK